MEPGCIGRAWIKWWGISEKAGAAATTDAALVFTLNLPFLQQFDGHLA